MTTDLQDLKAELEGLQKALIDTTAAWASPRGWPAINPGKMDLTTFSGELNQKENITDFINKFDLRARGMNLDKVQKAALLPLYLQGNALDLYSTLSQAVQNDYDKLATTLKTQLASPEARRFAR